MPRIASMSYSSTFNALHTEAKAIGENNDCAVKAVAMACNVPYATAHATLAQLGRKRGKGTYRTQSHKAIEQLGYKVRIWSQQEQRDLIMSYPKAHQILRHITTHHPRRFKKVWAGMANRTFLLFCSRHVAVVKGGELHDWTVNKAMRVLDIWEITDTAKPLGEFFK